MDEEVEKKLNEHRRRFEDRLKECKKDVDGELDSIALSIGKMQADIQAMKEILEAWNNMKGFASGMRFISAAIKIATPIIVIIGGFYWLIKTGQWPKG